MPLDIAQILVRRSVRALSGGHKECDKCHRTLLPGELMHVLKGGRRMCSLCLQRMPAKQRDPVRTERIHASDHHLPVAPRPA
jgi:hypothetical protein